MDHSRDTRKNTGFARLATSRPLAWPTERAFFGREAADRERRSRNLF